jgi:hypothetical protein
MATFSVNRVDSAMSALRPSRFVLFSSRASVGGGLYVIEAAYPLAA